MKYLKRFENVLEEQQINKIDEDVILEKAQSIINYYKDGPMWNIIIEALNEKGIDYDKWDDFDMIIYYIRNIQ